MKAASRDSVTSANHCSSHLELMVRFAFWVSELRTPLTYQRVVERFGCSSATAHRWIRAYRDATEGTKYQLAATGSQNPSQKETKE